MFKFAVLLMIIVLVLIITDAWFADRMQVKFAKEREAWQKERSELLDRIQAVDYTEFKIMNRERKQKSPDDRPKKTDLIEV